MRKRKTSSTEWQTASFFPLFFNRRCDMWLGWLVAFSFTRSSGQSGLPVLLLASSLITSPSDCSLPCSGAITDFSPWILILQATPCYTSFHQLLLLVTNIRCPFHSLSHSLSQEAFWSTTALTGIIPFSSKAWVSLQTSKVWHCTTCFHRWFSGFTVQLTGDLETLFSTLIFSFPGWTFFMSILWYVLYL